MRAKQKQGTTRNARKPNEKVAQGNAQAAQDAGKADAGRCKQRGKRTTMQMKPHFEGSADIKDR